ncbi:MAG TPA: hypothetical protein VKG43_02980 [Acidimicrobiales bacterium]|nr:hypothetical protein [Acidimicrobiales bacterium]
MPKAIYLVHTNPSSPEEDEEYNAWYDKVHLGEVTAIDGFVGASRYRAYDPGGSHRYLAIYEIDAPDPEAVITAMMNAAGDFTMSPALQMSPPPGLGLYEEITPA